MGSWFETCAITNLPIFWGDKCVMVTIDKKFINEFNGCIYPYLITDHVKQIVKGNYDSYGGIEDLKNSDDYSHLTSIFFKDTAWDWCLSVNSFDKIFLQIFGTFYDGRLTNEMKEFVKVLFRLNELRINPLGSLVFKGSEHYDLNEYVSWNKLFNKELKKIKTIKD